MRRAVLILAALALAAFTAHADSNKNISRTFDVGDGGTIHLDADAGDVHISSGGSGHVTVEVVERHDSDRFELTFDQKGSDVYVHSRDSERVRNRFFSFNWSNTNWVTFTIHVPARYNLDIHTSGGTITSGDVGGNADLHTSGGDIRLGRVNGTVMARSSGGDIRIEGAGGRVDAHTSGGDVEIRDAASSIEAKSSGGSIEIRRAGGSVVAHTSGGGIRIEDAVDAVDASTSGGSVTARFSRQPRADSRLSTSGGGVTVELAPSIGVELDAHASGGGVHSDMPMTIQGTHDDDSLQGKINGGGPRLILRTSGGGITVRRG